MKKLAIIGIAILGLTLTIAVSQAGAYPGMSKAEYRALMIRSGGLNQKYGIDGPVKGENYFARGLPTSAPLAVTSEPASTPFQWTDAGIGAASLLVLTGLVGTAVFSVRHSGHLGTS